jgi:hypothetical protein
VSFIPGAAFLSLVLFWLGVWLQDRQYGAYQERSAAIAISAPVQTIMYGGDRYLAANIEAIRAAASSSADEAHGFRLRAHLEASRLNPCHEDNYWIGNAALSWGGAEGEGLQLLESAIRCRYWDEWPAFFYGFNQHFFRKNTDEARWAVDLAAQRSKDNAAAFRSFYIMLAAGDIDDARLALEMIEHEREQARDLKLKKMLSKRVMRLQGLLLLRDAQARYERKFQRALAAPSDLVSSGIIKDFPDDPLGVGYNFDGKTFQLHQLGIQ